MSVIVGSGSWLVDHFALGSTFVCKNKTVRQAFVFSCEKYSTGEI
jgi:hypothetical protein